MFGVFKRIPDVSGIKSPGNGVFAAFMITYYLLFGFVFIVILQGEKTYLYNPYLWGGSVTGEKDFFLFYIALSFIPFKNAFVFMFYWHIFEVSVDLQKRVIRSSRFESLLFILVFVWFSLICSSYFAKIILLTIAVLIAIYYFILTRIFHMRLTFDIRIAILTSSIIALVLLLLIAPILD